MKLISLLFFSISILSCSQTKNNVDAIFIKSIYQQSKVLQEDKPIDNDNPETIYKYLYLINKTKDSIIFYDSAELKPISFVLSSTKDGKEILFTIKKNDESKSYKIHFDDEKHLISISKDVFILNTKYFNFLKDNILKRKNLLVFIDFLDDFLPEYSSDLQKLIYISANSKYKNIDFKIIKANIITKNQQTDNQYNSWNVEYKYYIDKLLSVKMFNKNEIRYEKQLITKGNSDYLYKFSKNIDERSSAEGTLKFDFAQNNYQEEGSYLQIGISRETFYKSYLIREKKIQLENAPSSPEKIKILFTKYLP